MAPAVALLDALGDADPVLAAEVEAAADMADLLATAGEIADHAEISDDKK